MKRARMPFEDYVEALFEIELPDGNTIRLPETGARTMWETGKPLDEIAKIASITDREGTPYLSDPFDLYFMLTSGATPKSVKEMLTITDDWGNSLEFDPNELSAFLSHGGTRDFAEQLFALTDSEDMPIFDGKAISDFRHYGGSVDYARDIASITDTEGNTVFSEGDIIAAYRYACKDISLARPLVKLKDSEGKSLFRDGADIFAWLYHGGSLEQAESYLSIAGTEGKTAFNGHDLALLKRHSVPPRYAAAMAAEGMNALTATYYHSIGFAPEDIGFARDGRPRALLLYPTNDYFYMGDGTFTSKKCLDFIKKIGQAYDIRLRAISTVSEMCSEIEATPDVRLLVLAGHGRRDLLCFGESSPKYGISVPERDRMLRPSSRKAACYLAMLPARATIFLNSCDNGKGRERGKNLANSVAEWAPGRRVISSVDTFDSYNLKVGSYYPLELRISSGRIFSDGDQHGECTDYTYVARRTPARRARGTPKRR